MAVRLKDRIEANIRQADKVNHNLRLLLDDANDQNILWTYDYDGSESKTITLNAAAVGALSIKGGALKGPLTLWSLPPRDSKFVTYLQRLSNDTTSETTWTSTNSSDANVLDTNVLGTNGAATLAGFYWSPGYGYTKTLGTDGTSDTWLTYSRLTYRQYGLEYGTGAVQSYYTDYRFPRGGKLTQNQTKYFVTSPFSSLGNEEDTPVYVNEDGELDYCYSYVPYYGGTFTGPIYAPSYYVESDHRYYASYYFARNSCDAGETWTSSDNTYVIAKNLSWERFAEVGCAVPIVATKTDSAGTTSTVYWNSYFNFRMYSMDSSTGEFLDYYHEFRTPSTFTNLTTSYTYYLTASSSLTRGSVNQPVYLSNGYLYTGNTFVPNTGGEFTGTVVFSNSTDASPTADNGPALIIGGTRTTAHIEIDNNEIMAKSDGDSETTLYLGGGGGGISIASPLTCSKTVAITGNTTLNGSLYARRAPNASCSLYFRRAPNPSTTTWTSSDGAYTYTIDKANGEVDIAYLSYSPSWAGKRVTVADGTTNNSYVSNGYLNFRNYSISSSTGAKLSYYYQFRLYPATPADLTANKTFYFAVHTNSSISKSTSKRYVVGISGAEGGLNYNESVYTSGSVLYGACWNDYAEYRAQNELLIAGHIAYCDDDGKLKYTTERLQKFEGVVSDTFGFSIGETDECKTPLAVSGRVLVYCDPEDHFHSGDCVCAGPDGKAYRMTREEIAMYPDRIVGVVSEIPTYEHWGTGNVKVNGRIWIKVK